MIFATRIHNAHNSIEGLRYMNEILENLNLICLLIYPLVRSIQLTKEANLLLFKSVLQFSSDLL